MPSKDPSLKAQVSLSRAATVEDELITEESQHAALSQPPDHHHNIPNAKAGPKTPAPRGECKFDGTDYPDWLPVNPFKKAEEPFAVPFPEVQGDPWANVAQLVKDYDDKMCIAWNEEIQNILLFAGLFSAVVTAFAIETQSMLQPDPAIASVLLLAQISVQFGNGSSLTSANAIASQFQNQNNPTQSVRINALIYFSLVLSLGTALVGIIALQWIRAYRQYESQSHEDRLSLRHIRYESLIKWKVPQIISTLPIVLQASLLIFFAGLIDFLHTLNSTVTIIISLLIAAIVSLVLFTTVAPGISVVVRPWSLGQFSITPPYQSPQSWLFVRVVLRLKKAYHLARFTLNVGGGWFMQKDLMEATNGTNSCRDNPKLFC